jgi:hypothetical protein
VRGRACGEYGVRKLGCSRVGRDIGLLCTRYRNKFLPNTSNSDALTTTAVDATITTIPTDIVTVSLCDATTCPPTEDDKHPAASLPLVDPTFPNPVSDVRAGLGSKARAWARLLQAQA